MELQVPYSICAKVSQKGVLWRETARDRRNIEDTVQLEEDKDSRSRSVPGPRTYAGRDTAEGSDIELHGIPKGKEQSDDLREVPRAAVQVPEPGILVLRILRRYGGKECKEDRGVHPSSIRRGQSRRTTDNGEFLSPFTGSR